MELRKALSEVACAKTLAPVSAQAAEDQDRVVADLGLFRKWTDVQTVASYRPEMAKASAPFGFKVKIPPPTVKRRLAS